MRHKRRFVFLTALTLITVLAMTASRGHDVVANDRYTPVPASDPGVSAFLAAAQNPHFLDHVTFTPESATYYDLVNQVFPLNAPESQLLTQNGFVVTDRLAFTNFSVAYAYIYWKDLPVLVTTDSILHAVHQSYDDLLKQTETAILSPMLTDFLTKTQQRVRADASANNDPALASLYDDLNLYLAVPLSLLTGVSGDTPGSAADAQLVQAANSVADVNLFGLTRPVDFTLFQPRGHYSESPASEHYFQAFTWLTQMDFRLVSYNPDGTPVVNGGQIAAAALLRSAINEANQSSTWATMDNLFTDLIGRSDNVTLAGLDRFLADADTNAPGDFARNTHPDEWMSLLTSHVYGGQAINGQLMNVAADNPNPLPNPVSFTLFGQRYSLDSDIMGSLMYDRLLVNGQKVERPLPSPLDVMYTLGNDQAATHLQSELERYHYQDNLTALRQEVNNYDSSVWSSSLYNRWLGALRALNDDTTGDAYPQSMRTAGWADKMLQTELASWTQLRHDNILYTVQPFAVSTLCQYPAGYVEPYPAFYAAVGDYARNGEALFTSLDSGLLTGQYAQSVQQSAMAYFDTLMGVADHLQAMAEKELRQEPFTADEESFIKSIAIHEVQKTYCSNCYQQDWTGWYPALFPWQQYGTTFTPVVGGLDNPALVADLATNPNTEPGSALYPPGVLYSGTGTTSLMIFVADTDEGPTMYVGPAFSYYEAIEEGFPQTRLTDETWNFRLNADPRPPAPSWTGSFRAAVLQPPPLLELPIDPNP